MSLSDHYRPVLGRLHKLRKCRRENTWSACCPAHQDERPSLLVFIGRTGALQARCLSKGCSFDSIVRATRTEHTDWFPPREDRRARRRMSEPQRKIVATYSYNNARGELLFQVLRLEPGHNGRRKDFVQRRPIPQWAGQDRAWAYSLAAGTYRKRADKSFTWDLMPDGTEFQPGDLALEEVERTLYRLPDLLERPGEPIIVVEGEGKVELLRSLNLLATTSPHGAGHWLLPYGQVLTGRRLAILPDNNEIGRQHAAQVAGSCLLHGAESIRIVELPGLKDGEDVKDWLAAHTQRDTGRKHLIECIRMASVFQQITGAAARCGERPCGQEAA